MTNEERDRIFAQVRNLADAGHPFMLIALEVGASGQKSTGISGGMGTMPNIMDMLEYIAREKLSLEARLILVARIMDDRREYRSVLGPGDHLRTYQRILPRENP